ncbi:MAG: extracellular solute-binding protein, partial [Chloroflexota bacterium]|nr:extracellular solute-binding protein [Chloroflexota bacterium]
MSAVEPRALLYPKTSPSPDNSNAAPTGTRPLTRRALFGRALIGAQVVLLAACGGGDENEEEQPRAAPTAPQASLPKPAGEPTTLTLASMLVSFAPVIDKAVDEWNRGEFPGASEDIQLERLTIQISSRGGPEETTEHIQERAQTFLAERESAGTPLDLLIVNRLFDFPWAFRSGILQPLDRLLQQDGNDPSARFMPSALELTRFRGQMMALPVSLGAGVTRYNPKHFEDAGLPVPDNGWTREEFIAAALRLTQDTDNDGKIDSWGFRPIWNFVNWLPFVMQELDRDVVDVNTGEVRLLDPAALRGLQFWHELGNKHGIMPHGADVTADLFRFPFWNRHPSTFFYYFATPSSTATGKQAPLPAGPRDVSPLMLGACLAIPAGARDTAKSYEALAPLALYLGEHFLLPTVISGQEFIENPTSGYIELLLPEHERQLA